MSSTSVPHCSLGSLAYFGLLGTYNFFVWLFETIHFNLGPLGTILNHLGPNYKQHLKKKNTISQKDKIKENIDHSV